MEGVKYFVDRKLINTLVEDEKFMEDIAERLMLEEVLAGECDPVRFLKQTMKEVYAERARKNRSRFSSRVEESLTEWVEER